ncbi:MAG TPA: ABC transporter ATP-binding protein [Chthoniobacterales bacterium]|nr:ABC transporter ATP-binding protein [Chthoniobacterales bacterium]
MHYLLAIIRFSVQYLRRYWPALIAGIFFSIVFGLSNGALIWGTKTILERLSPAPVHQQGWSDEAGPSWVPGVPQRLAAATHNLVDPWLPRVGRNIDAGQVIGGVLFLPLLIGLRGLSRYLSAWSMAFVSENVVNDLRCDVLQKLQSLSMDYFNRARMGDLLQRINGDTAALNRCLSLGFTDSLTQPFAMIGIALNLFLIDWRLTICALLLTPLCLIPIAKLGKRARSAASVGVRATISQSSLLVEMLNGIRVVKALNLEAEQTSRYRAFSKELVQSSIKSTQAREQINPIIETFSMFGLGLLIIYVFYSHRTTPEMVAFLAGMLLFFGPVKRLASLHLLLQESKIGVDRLSQVLAEQPSVKEKPNAKPLPAFTSSIAFRGVSFAYATQPVLEQIDLEIRRGTRLGIAGENGSGKSTLVNLMLRFYDPTSGTVEIDGVDLRDVRVPDLRNLIGLVSQEVVIFDQSIAENIACAKPGTTREEIEAAAKLAGCHEFITGLADGYETRVGERGLRLSGGQRQRVSIARAFIRDAPIIILDEATASLDARAEADIQAAVDRLEEHRTVICVAHRLSTLSAMDRIVVLAAGRIVEEGTYRQLLAGDGPFSRMARQQGLTLTAHDLEFAESELSA